MADPEAGPEQFVREGTCISLINNCCSTPAPSVDKEFGEWQCTATQTWPESHGIRATIFHNSRTQQRVLVIHAPDWVRELWVPPLHALGRLLLPCSSTVTNALYELVTPTTTQDAILAWVKEQGKESNITCTTGARLGGTLAMALAEKFIGLKQLVTFDSAGYPGAQRVPLADEEAAYVDQSHYAPDNISCRQLSDRPTLHSWRVINTMHWRRARPFKHLTFLILVFVEVYLLACLLASRSPNPDEDAEEDAPKDLQRIFYYAKAHANLLWGMFTSVTIITLLIEREQVEHDLRFAAPPLLLCLAVALFVHFNNNTVFAAAIILSIVLRNLRAWRKHDLRNFGRSFKDFGERHSDASSCEGIFQENRYIMLIYGLPWFFLRIGVLLVLL